MFLYACVGGVCVVVVVVVLRANRSTSVLHADASDNSKTDYDVDGRTN